MKRLRRNSFHYVFELFPNQALENIGFPGPEPPKNGVLLSKSGSIQISSPDQGQGEGQGQGEPPQPNPIDMNAIIQNEDPSILAQIAQDTIERLQELQKQSQSYLAGFENTNSLDYLQAALQLAEVSAQLADLTNQFMSAVEGTEQEQQINEILQEYNTSLEDMRQQIEQLSNEIQELKETLVETAQEAGISPEEIERILQNAPTAGAGADSSTSLPPLPETPVTPPTSGGESSGDTGDREEEPGSGGEPGGEEPGGEEPGGEEPGNDEYQGPKAASPGVVLAKYDDVSEEFEYDDILQFYFDKPVKVEPLLDIEKWNAALQNVYPDGSFGSGEDTISYSYFHEDEQGVEYAKDFSIRLTDGFNLPKNGLTFTLVSEGYLIEEDNEIIVMESGEIRADFTIPSILTNNIYWNYGASVTNLDYPFGEEFSDVGSYAIFNDDNLIPENFELIGVIGTLIPIDIYEEKHITLLGEPSASVNIWYYDKSFVRKDLSKDWLKAEIVSYGMTYGDPTYTWRVVLPKEITDAINTSLPNSSRDYFIALEIQGEIQDETQDGATWKSVPIEAVGAITKDNIAPSVKFDGFNGHQLWLDINEPIRHFQETSFEEFFDEFIEKSFIEGLTIRIGKGDNALTYSGEEVKTLIDNVDFYKEVSTQPRYDLTAAIYFSESAWNLFNNKEYIEDHFTPVVIAYKPDLVAEPITDMAGNEMSFSITLYYHEVWGMWTEYSNATIEVLDYNEETQEILLETEELLCTVNEDGIVIPVNTGNDISVDNFKLYGLDGEQLSLISGVEYTKLGTEDGLQYGQITLKLTEAIKVPTILIWDSDYVCQHGQPFTTLLESHNIKFATGEGVIKGAVISAIKIGDDWSYISWPQDFGLNFKPADNYMLTESLIYYVESWRGLAIIPDNLMPYFSLQNVAFIPDRYSVVHPRPTTAYFKSIKYIKEDDPDYEGELLDGLDQIIFEIEPGNLTIDGLIIPNPALKNRWGLNYQLQDFEPYLKLRYYGYGEWAYYAN